MKNFKIILAVASLLYFSGCTQPKAEEMLNNHARKQEIFSAILSNDAACSELMDSMMMTHHEQMMTKMNDMMKGNQPMQMGLMDNMMGMCKDDSSMCKMMMGKTMDMCDSDNGKCKMMMGTMQEHPKAMESMKGMGMCDMKDMKGMKMK